MAPTSDNPVKALQGATVAKLRADTALVTLLGVATKVVDFVDERLAKPYVRVGEFLSIPDNDLGSFGRNITMTIHIWTEARGNATGQDIADRITAILDHQPGALVLAGHRIVSIRQEFDQSLTDPDPEIRHHVLRFRILTAQQA